MPQQAKLNRDCATNDGRKIAHEFFIIESARQSDKRDDFYQAVDYLKKNPNIKFVYIEKTDRLTRNLKDTVLAYDLVNNFDISFVFTRDNFVLNKASNSHAKFQFDIKAVLAKNYVDNLSDEVKKGQRGMLEDGGWPGGTTPTGYLKMNKRLVPKEPHATFVRRAFELYATGAFSLLSLKKKLEIEGFRSYKDRLLTVGNFHIILKNPIYYGMNRWNKQLYLGNHEPLISKGLFDQVQAMLQRSKNGKVMPVYAKHDFTYRGSLSCGECGGKITAEEKKKVNKGNGREHRWVYYHCTHYKKCSQKGMVREEIIEDQILMVLRTLTLGPHTTEWLKNKLKESHQEEMAFNVDAIKELNERHLRIKGKLNRLYDDRLDGYIDETTYLEKRDPLLKEQEETMESLKRHNSADKSYTDFGCLILDVANKAAEIFKVRESEEKRYLLNLVFSNLSLKDKKVEFSLSEVFQAVVNYQKDKSWLGSRDSNPNRQLQRLLSYH